MKANSSKKKNKFSKMITMMCDKVTVVTYRGMSRQYFPPEDTSGWYKGGRKLGGKLQ